MKRKFLKTWIIYLFNGVIIEKEFYEGFKDVAIVQLLFVFLKKQQWYVAYILDL